MKKVASLVAALLLAAISFSQDYAIGLNGSSHDTEDITLPEPPIKPRNGTMQQSDALAEVTKVNNTGAFISDLKLYCC